jgi:hypothetical protein
MEMHAVFLCSTMRSRKVDRSVFRDAFSPGSRVKNSNRRDDTYVGGSAHIQK